jgi:hypothetical protein
MAVRAHWNRRLATGTNAVLVTLFIVAIAVVLVVLSGRFRLRWDLSSDAVATLQPETLGVLDVVDHQDGLVEVVAFSSQRKDSEALFRDRMMKDLLRELEYRSSHLSTRFVDFDGDRMTAESLGVSRYGTVVVRGQSDRVDIIDRDLFRRQGRGEDSSLEFLGEAAIARAISEVLSEVPRTVYLLQGHGEKKFDGSVPGGLQLFATLLENQGYTVTALDLLRDGEGAAPSVPGDANAVLVVGPAAPLTPVEEGVLTEYLGRGGRIGYFVDPGGFVADLIEGLGVTVPGGVVLDTVAVFPHEDRPLLRYGRHAITEELLTENTATLVAHAAPLVVTKRDDVDQVQLLQTSRSGWIERGTERPAVYQEGEDGAGPVGVAVALTPRLVGSGAPARVLVVGDSDLVADELIAEGPGNSTFAVNAVRWLVGEDERMSEVGRPSQIRKLALSREQLSMIQWVVLGLMPLLAVLAGAAVWSARRGR